MRLNNLDKGEDLLTLSQFCAEYTQTLLLRYCIDFVNFAEKSY